MFWSIKFRTVPYIINIQYEVFKLKARASGNKLTSLWTAGWNITVPDSIMLALSGFWTIYIISIITAVVGYRVRAVTSHPDFSILWSIKFRAILCREYIWIEILQEK